MTLLGIAGWGIGMRATTSKGLPAGGVPQAAGAGHKRTIQSIHAEVGPVMDENFLGWLEQSLAFLAR